MSTITEAEQQLLADADARIAKNRKSELVVKLRDAAGQPLANVPIRITQKKHRFGFGNTVFSVPKMDTPELTKSYIEQFCSLYNYATLPFYWKSYEKERGTTRQGELLAIAAWCSEHGFAVKGHPLVWHEGLPPWSKDLSFDEAMRLQQERVGREIKAFTGIVDRWDVINEATAAERWETVIKEWFKKVGPAEMMERSLTWAREANPKAYLLVNEFNTKKDFEEALERVVPKGLMDCIGIQSHMHATRWSLAEAWRVCEAFGRFGLPVHFTELTVLSGAPKPQDSDWYTTRPDWHSTPEGEADQAEYLSRLYTLWFSHPAVQAITQWGFKDPMWLGAPGGLIRKDGTEKPAYTALKNLIKAKWWTNAETKTDAAGAARLSVFQGAHDVETGGAHHAVDVGDRPSELVIRA